MNSNNYLEILGDHVQPAMDFYFPNKNEIFQNDNAHIHRAKKVENWFETFSGSFQNLYWLPKSPDLSPIENLWDELKRKLRDSSSLRRTLPDLEEKLLQLWTKIDLCRMKNTVNSIPS